jgi:hypothetical protein
MYFISRSVIIICDTNPNFVHPRLRLRFPKVIVFVGNLTAFDLVLVEAISSFSLLETTEL